MQWKMDNGKWEMGESLKGIPFRGIKVRGLFHVLEEATKPKTLK